MGPELLQRKENHRTKIFSKKKYRKFKFKNIYIEKKFNKKFIKKILFKIFDEILISKNKTKMHLKKFYPIEIESENAKEISINQKVRHDF